ncbi:MAG: hypothetical protein FWC16_12055 [Defluviitaleaceae bacterium]|nr:hypothetical protein [Defluviitaleaceae bacterium]MCL2275652.1 hypothetical protein [Defluviitaleaceae bacterium]
MNITLNNTSHQVNASVGKNGVLKFSLGDSEKMSFSELQKTMNAKAVNNEERAAVANFMQFSDETILQGQARMAKSSLFNQKWALASAGDFNARDDIIALFERFGLSRFLTRNMNDGNNFVTNLVSMNHREREAFLRLEAYVLGGNRI